MAQVTDPPLTGNPDAVITLINCGATPGVVTEMGVVAMPSLDTTRTEILSAAAETWNAWLEEVPRVDQWTESNDFWMVQLSFAGLARQVNLATPDTS